jgi:hypothetical protein
MIGLEDRQQTAQRMAAAHRDGARLHKACEVAGTGSTIDSSLVT